MFDYMIKIFFPPSGASSRQFRVSGIVFLIVALTLVVAGYILFEQIQLLLIPLLLIPMSIWIIGIHRILLGVTVPESRSSRVGLVLVAIVVGYLSFSAIGGLLWVIIDPMDMYKFK